MTWSANKTVDFIVEPLSFWNQFRLELRFFGKVNYLLGCVQGKMKVVKKLFGEEIGKRRFSILN